LGGGGRGFSNTALNLLLSNTPAHSKMNTKQKLIKVKTMK
jgi:hypothetical protein